MREIGASEAESKLGLLLDLVEAGEEVVITRRGKPIARLLPSTNESQKARRAAESIRAMSSGVTLGSTTIETLIAEGRL